MKWSWEMREQLCGLENKFRQFLWDWSDVCLAGKFIWRNKKRRDKKTKIFLNSVICRLSLSFALPRINSFMECGFKFTPYYIPCCWNVQIFSSRQSTYCLMCQTRKQWKASILITRNVISPLMVLSVQTIFCDAATAKFIRVQCRGQVERSNRAKKSV